MLIGCAHADAPPRTAQGRRRCGESAPRGLVSRPQTDARSRCPRWLESCRRDRARWSSRGDDPIPLARELLGGGKLQAGSTKNEFCYRLRLRTSRTMGGRLSMGSATDSATVDAPSSSMGALDGPTIARMSEYPHTPLQTLPRVATVQGPDQTNGLLEKLVGRLDAAGQFFMAGVLFSSQI